jgi:hydrogenase nickel incorporation protein HypA/HybF
MAQGATLEIELVPATCWCAKCQAEFASEDFLGECPQCRELSAELRHGTELEIASVEVS